MVYLSCQKRDGITGPNGTFFQNNRKNTFPGHDAVAHLLADGAVRMALFSDLRDFQQDIPNSEPGPNGKRVQRKPLC